LEVQVSLELAEGEARYPLAAAVEEVEHRFLARLAEQEVEAVLFLERREEEEEGRRIAIGFARETVLVAEEAVA